jgi:hypothetical protein
VGFFIAHPIFQGKSNSVMKVLITLILACSLPVFAQTPKAAVAPKYRTAQEIKVFWLNKMPIPRTLDKDYKEMVDARANFVTEVREGKYNDLAEKTAAQLNAELAVNSGDNTKAAFYNAKVEQCDKAIEATAKAAALKAEAAAAKAEAAAGKAEAARNITVTALLQSQLCEINKKLSKLEDKK